MATDKDLSVTFSTAPSRNETGLFKRVVLHQHCGLGHLPKQWADEADRQCATIAEGVAFLRGVGEATKVAPPRSSRGALGVEQGDSGDFVVAGIITDDDFAASLGPGQTFSMSAEYRGPDRDHADEKAEADKGHGFPGEESRDGGAGMDGAHALKPEAAQDLRAAFVRQLADEVRQSSLPETTKWVLLQLLGWDRFRSEVLGTPAAACPASAQEPAASVRFAREDKLARAVVA